MVLHTFFGFLDVTENHFSFLSKCCPGNTDRHVYNRIYLFLRRYDVTSPGACAVLYQAIWRDSHLVRGHGFANHSFWITKEFCIQPIAFLQTLKYARPDKSNAMQRNLTLEK